VRPRYRLSTKNGAKNSMSCTKQTGASVMNVQSPILPHANLSKISCTPTSKNPVSQAQTSPYKSLFSTSSGRNTPTVQKKHLLAESKVGLFSSWEAIKSAAENTPSSRIGHFNGAFLLFQLPSSWSEAEPKNISRSTNEICMAIGQSLRGRYRLIR